MHCVCVKPLLFMRTIQNLVCPDRFTWRYVKSVRIVYKTITVYAYYPKSREYVLIDLHTGMSNQSGLMVLWEWNIKRNFRMEITLKITMFRFYVKIDNNVQTRKFHVNSFLFLLSDLQRMPILWWQCVHFKLMLKYLTLVLQKVMLMWTLQSLWLCLAVVIVKPRFLLRCQYWFQNKIVLYQVPFCLFKAYSPIIPVNVLNTAAVNRM